MEADRSDIAIAMTFVGLYSLALESGGFSPGIQSYSVYSRIWGKKPVDQ